MPLTKKQKERVAQMAQERGITVDEATEAYMKMLEEEAADNDVYGDSAPYMGEIFPKFLKRMKKENPKLYDHLSEQQSKLTNKNVRVIVPAELVDVAIVDDVEGVDPFVRLHFSSSTERGRFHIDIQQGFYDKLQGKNQVVIGDWYNLTIEDRKEGSEYLKYDEETEKYIVAKNKLNSLALAEITKLGATDIAIEKDIKRQERLLQFETKRLREEDKNLEKTLNRTWSEDQEKAKALLGAMAAMRQRN